MLSKWAEMGLTRFDDDDAYVQAMTRMTAEVRALLERCGASRSPRMDDLQLYERWIADFPRPLIDYAADCARGMDKPMLYMDKVLSEWKKSGVSTADEARAQHESRARSEVPAAGKPNPALDYAQRSAAETDYSSRIVDLSEYDEQDGEA